MSRTNTPALPPPPSVKLNMSLRCVLKYFTLILQECRWLHWPGRAEVDAGIDRRANYGGWHRGADERRGQEQRRQNRLRWWEVWTVFICRQRHELCNKLLGSKLELGRHLLTVSSLIWQSSWSSWKEWSNPERDPKCIFIILCASTVTCGKLESPLG